MTDSVGRRTGRRIVTGLSFAAAGGLVLPAGVAHADPEPSEDEVRERVQELDEEVSELVEAYNEAEEDAEAAEERLEEIEEQIEEEEERHSGLRDDVRQLASSVYQGNDLDSTTNILSVDDPDTLLEQADDLDYLSDSRYAQLEEFVESSERLEGLREEAEEAHDEADEHLSDIEEQREEVEEALAEQEALLDEFDSPGSTESVDYDGSASGDARGAIDYALAQVGKPYVWGGTGPDGFDCSGLTMRAWGSVGVNLPRTTGGQSGVGTRVSKGELQPGDLVFFYGGVSHMGLYLGDNQMVHAPSSGRHVEVVSLAGYWDGHFQFGVRV
ncbi:C40 family peptidase [Lipingzhangella sp. LS1_29]|uniref:C40 family peptidase n=1 Tax=Lipingzhangella rawalii TaxID=2055835 RepID=A0ABU2H056_9ACTN|nr:C40 family peptidase [Lipingzhangella rawalii]MDS1268698.1 C40 family peptidase [Lipingzhangella rawalii]